jgi:hypothetical protein
MVLSERQQLAKSLADDLNKMDGAWVTSPLPLDADAKLRVQIKDIDRNRIIQWLKDLGWDPVCVSVLPRVCTTGLIGACLYEIDLPRERQPIPQDDRVIPKDDVGQRETNREVELMLTAIYGKQKRK